MTFTQSILALLLATPSVEPGDASRLEPVAVAIAEESEASPLWPDEQGTERTAHLLVAIAIHESGLRESVRRCVIKGDQNTSLGLWQLHTRANWGGHAPEAVCADDALQARLALRVLGRQRDRGVRDPDAMLRAYASGNAARHTRAARELSAGLRRVRRLAQETP